MSTRSSRLDLADLEALPRDRLIALWRSHVSDHVPPQISRRLLVAAIAFEGQLAAAPASTRSVWKQVRRQVAAPEPSGKPDERLTLQTPGTRLMRQWNGRTHIIEITTDGCRWNGTTYRSLSAVARAITGAHWSGPRFFRSCTRAAGRNGATP